MQRRESGAAQRSRCTAVMFLALGAGLTACGDTGGRGASGGARPLFTELHSAETEVAFRNDLDENPIMNGFTYEYFYNGGGVAAGDLTGNGYPDLYFTGNRVPNRLYLNEGGMRFRDVTAEAGVAGHQGWATGVTFADVNGDGLLDIYVSYSGAYDDPHLRRNQLFINHGTTDGLPRFTEEAAAWGLDDTGLTTQTAFFASNESGLPDAYVMNHGVAGFASMEELLERRTPHAIDRFYRNEGGRFVDASADVGLIQNDLGFGLGVSPGNLNNSGYGDLYVANDYSGRDHLYLGRADGAFDEVLTESVAHTPFASMGSDIADIDGDGWLDVMVLEMAMTTHYDRAMSESGIDGERFANVVDHGQHYQYVANALQWNRGADEEGVPIFSEVAQLAGVASSDWSWAVLFADLTNSGLPDLFITNGTPSDMVHRDFQTYRNLRVEEVLEEEGRVTHSLMVDLLENRPRRRVPNKVFRNDGNLSFTDMTREWGLERPTYSNGAVYVDLDRDGDLDLVVNNLMEEASIYRNEARGGPDAHFLAIQLKGAAPNRFGVGARVRVHSGGRTQVQELQLTRGYQSSVEPILHFGLGSASRVDSLTVVWPDGSRQTVTDVAADRYIELDQAEAARGTDGGGEMISRRFVAASDRLSPAPRHTAMVATEDASVRAYPAERETFALAVGDLDGSGRDDFVFGGSAGEPARVYFQDENGGFQGVALPGPAGGGPPAVSAALLDAQGDGRLDIWLVHEQSAGGRLLTYRHRLLLNLGDGRFEEAAPGAVPELSGSGPVLSVGDVDGDGADDLFVGTWQAPDATASAGSRLLRNEGGVFRDVTSELAPGLDTLRTVTAAVWTDLYGGGPADLVIVGHWLPVTVWRNDDGSLSDATAEAGLSELTGWWESILAADLNGDGAVDLVAGNLGLNFPYQPAPDRPFELYVADFTGEGGLQAIPAYYEDGRLYPWLHRDELAEEVPFVLEKYPTHHSFAVATLADIFGAETLRDARRLQVTEAASMYLANTGEGAFRPEALPRPAQVSPVTGAVAADFDRDGILDLVIGGSLYELAPPVPRADAGVGLFLRGDGTGGLEPIMPQASGLLMNGRVRRVVPISDGSGGPPGLLVGVVGEGVRYIRPAVVGAGAGSPGEIDGASPGGP